MLTLANVGVPMLLVYAPVLVLGLVPIVLVEFLVTRRYVEASFERLLGSVALANVVSSVVGVPLTWGVMVVLQISFGGAQALGVNWKAVVLQAPWLIPYEADLHWMIPVAGIVLTVPFCIASAVVESLVLVRMLPGVERRRIWRSCWLANLLSYAMLAVFWSCLLLNRPQG